MKLKKISPKFTPNSPKRFSIYEGKLGEYKVVIRERQKCWTGSLLWGNESYHCPNTETLRGAKLAALTTYIRRLLNILHRKYQHDSLFRKLYEACWFSTDVASPSVLCDWLSDQGDDFRTRLVETCRKAGIKYYPCGWGPALESAVRSKR